MGSVQLTTLGTVLLASALPVVGAVLVIVDHPRTVPGAVPELQLPFDASLQTFSGKIFHKGGKFIFHEQHGIVYYLDNQQQARRFSGKGVIITGTIDPKTNVVHVRKIESS